MFKRTRFQLLMVAMLPAILLIIAFIVALPTPVRAAGVCDNVTEIPTSECDVLVSFFQGNGGEEWTHNEGWLQTNTPCNWYGIACTEDGHVSEIILDGKNVRGALPLELFELTYLVKLILNGNPLSGTIPEAIQNLSLLEELGMDNTHLIGIVPDVLGSMPALKSIGIRWNPNLGGCLPVSLTNLNLNTFKIVGTQLSVPTDSTFQNWLGTITNFESTNVPCNFCDTVTEIPQAQCEALVDVYGALNGRNWTNNNNWLMSTTPCEWYGISCTNGEVTQITLNNNNLEGGVPASLGDLTALTHLELRGNAIAGSLPDSLWQLTDLSVLSLEENSLQDILPPEVDNLTNLTWLGLDDNVFKGEIPLEITNLSSLSYLSFANTNLCEPTDATFQIWLSSVPTVIRNGQLCPEHLLMIYAFSADNDPIHPANLTPLVQPAIDGLIESTIDLFDKTIIALADLDGDDDTTIYHIQNGVITPIVGLPDATGILSTTITEYDMTDGATLGGFLTWALDNYATVDDEVTFSYIGHGGGVIPYTDWSAILGGNVEFLSESTIFPLPLQVDSVPIFTDKDKFITPHALQKALEIGTNGGTRPITVLDLSHCFAASIEEFYEVANSGGTPYVDVIIGSPNYAYFAPSALGNAVQSTLITHDAGLIGTAIVNAYDQTITTLEGDVVIHPRSWTVVDSTHLATIKHNVDELATQLMYALNGTNGENPVEVKEKFLTAYANAGMYYDTTQCSADFELTNADSLVDIKRFMQALRDEFDHDGIDHTALKVIDTVDSAVITTIAHNGTSWFASQFWDFEDVNNSGLSISSPFQGVISGTLTHQLPWNTAFYTDTLSVFQPNDNPYPFLFIQPDLHPNTWADVVHKLWQIRTADEGIDIETTACIPELPPVWQSAELTANVLLAPTQSTARMNAEYRIGGTLTTDVEIRNVTIQFNVLLNGTPVFTNTIGSGRLVTGTHYVESSQAWSTTSAGEYEFRMTVDSDGRFDELNESNNVAWRIDYVSSGDTFEFSAELTNNQQMWSSRSVSLDFVCSQDPTKLEVDAYQYDTDPNIQHYYLVDTWTIDYDQTCATHALVLPPAIQPGAVVLYIWGYSDGLPTSHPAIVEFNYAPTNHVLGNEKIYYLYNSLFGDTLQFDINFSGGDGQLIGWSPNNHWVGTQIVGSGSLSIDPTREGTYLVLVEGSSSDATYTLTATRNGNPGRQLMSGTPIQIDRPYQLPPPPQPPSLPPTAVTGTTMNVIQPSAAVVYMLLLLLSGQVVFYRVKR